MKRTVKVTKADVPVLANLDEWQELAEETDRLRRAVNQLKVLYFLYATDRIQPRPYEDAEFGHTKPRKIVELTTADHVANLLTRLIRASETLNAAIVDKQGCHGKNYEAGGRAHNQLIKRAAIVRTLGMMAPGDYEDLFLAPQRKAALDLACAITNGNIDYQTLIDTALEDDVPETW